MKTLNCLKSLLIVATALISRDINAKVILPEILSDNMVLQQNTDVKLWGDTDSKNEIVIKPSWDNSTYKTKPDKNGYWEIKIKTPQASYNNYKIEISDGEILSLENILIGEVWFCSGQSNMEMPLIGFWGCPVDNSTEDIATSGQFNGIRVATIERIGSDKPLKNCKGSWKVSNPENSPWFTATGFHFAKMMNKVLDVPVGIINCSWGGSRVEGWLPEEIVKEFKDIDYKKEMVLHEQGYWEYMSPIVMYNGMLKPLQNYTIKGFLWYQGESNVGMKTSYAERLKVMVDLWRKEWQLGELPFFIAEVAPYDYNSGIEAAKLREQQVKASEIISNSGIVCTNDLVYSYEKPQVHPRNKKDVGYRFAYQALNKVYNQKGINGEFAKYKEMKITGEKAEISFHNAEYGLSPWIEIKGFEIAGEDKVFYPADAELSYNRNTVILSSKQVSSPVAVRYCFKDFEPGNLIRSNNMPVIPFRTDNW